jgi:hypothetical protein
MERAIVITGAVGDYGTATTVNKNGQPDQTGDYSLIKLKDGTLEANLTSFNERTPMTGSPSIREVARRRDRRPDRSSSLMALGVTRTSPGTRD